MSSRRSLVLPLLAGVVLSASYAALPQEGKARDDRPLTKLERAELLAAQERAAIRRRAAEEAERAADELEATAAELERLAEKARQAATKARQRADAARTRAREARGAAGGAQQGGAPAGRSPQPTPRSGGSDRAPAAQRESAPSKEAGIALRTFDESRARAMAERVARAANRTAEENKAAFLPGMREGRGWDPKGRGKQQSLTHKPGAAPDIGDVDFDCGWQWGLNVARGGKSFVDAAPGSLSKTGNVDLARLTFQPAREGFGATGMKWGMRRYNLGDVTVTDCDFTDIPLEHGVYDNLSGHGLYRGSSFLRLGGQAIQIAHRDRPYQQYAADNLPFTGGPLIVVEDCHAVDVGRHASRAGFAWTFFDPGTYEHPGTVILRGSSVVSAWDFSRTGSGEAVGADHPRALRASGGLVVTHFREAAPDAEGYPTRDLVVDACLFDLTRAENPVAAVRGVGTILLEDSVFIARDHRRPYFDVDDTKGARSGRVIIQNCLSPPGAEVWLRIRGRKVVSLHTPGKRLEIDVATGNIEEMEPVETPLTRVESPLAGRVVRPGIRPQPPGHVDDLGELDFSGVR